MQQKINKKLMPMKAHYFLFNAGTAPVVPFMPTYARQLGFSSVVVGTIYLILPIIGMIAKPTFGAISDRFLKHKILFLCFQILTAVAFFCILFIPTIPQSAHLEFHCNDGASDLRYCPRSGDVLDECRLNNDSNETLHCQLTCDVKEEWMLDVICDQWNNNSSTECRNSNVFILNTYSRLDQIETLNECLYINLHRVYLNDNYNSSIGCLPSQNSVRTICTASCNDSNIMGIVTETKISNDQVTTLYQFWLFFLFLALSWIGMAVVVSVGDAICFEMLDCNPNLFGKQRLWGAVGWGTFALLSGVLVDTFSQNQWHRDYTVVFIMTVVLLGGDMIVSTKLQHVQNKVSVNIVRDVGTLFRSKRILIFFMWCIIVGICTALVWNFLFWHLEDLADAIEGCDHQYRMKTLQGLVMGIQCFGGELPFFFISGWLLSKIGHVNAMSLVLLGFGIRFILYSLLTNPWWVLPIEFMNGITFGIFYSTMASYASIVAPPGTEATLQGIVGAIFEGVGVSIGSLIGGILISKIGGSATFRVYGLMALGAFVVHILIQKLLQKRGKDIININLNYDTDNNIKTDDNHNNNTDNLRSTVYTNNSLLSENTGGGGMTEIDLNRH